MLDSVQEQRLSLRKLGFGAVLSLAMHGLVMLSVQAFGRSQASAAPATEYSISLFEASEPVLAQPASSAPAASHALAGSDSNGEVAAIERTTPVRPRAPEHATPSTPAADKDSSAERPTPEAAAERAPVALDSGQVVSNVEPTGAASSGTSPRLASVAGGIAPAASHVSGLFATGPVARQPAVARREPHRTSVLQFGPGMTPPRLLSMRAPTYSREASLAKVRGLVLAKCVITRHGTLERCRLLKGLSHMNDAVLAALADWRYTPVTYQGESVTIEYLVRVLVVPPS